ncbi:Mur ligase [Mycena maculata]|uniref:Mur ligase n=1 Tax=Mycena maculata TaxID=230809 RepID=A0AAD7NE30_9AGAR|nr:Mur ligase [Mycena maculata]
MKESIALNRDEDAFWDNYGLVLARPLAFEVFSKTHLKKEQDAPRIRSHSKKILCEWPQIVPRLLLSRGLCHVGANRLDQTPMSIDLTLDRIQRLARHLPAYTRPTCHVAGTNGKGSVSAIMSSMLSSSNPPLSIGRFNSPHLVSVRDSIVINNESVSSQVYDAARLEVERADKEQCTGVSSFEILTLTALLIFERAQLDVVVIEVGMGGRLDATNIIPDECVLVSALTAVDLDHQAFLGNSVSAIAAEKAAIARKGKPFVMGGQTDPEVETVVANVVNAAQAELLYALPVFARAWDTVDGPAPQPFSLSAAPFIPPPPLPVRFSMPCFEHPVLALLPLYGEHQLDNLGLAVSIVSAVLMNSAWIATRARFTNASIAQGIRSVKWPGRLSFHTLNSPPLTVLVDGAHNPASAKTLAAYLSHLVTLRHDNQRPLSLTYILALSHSPPKTPRETLAPLLPFDAPKDVQVDVSVALLRFTPPDGMPWVTSVPPTDLQAVVKSLAPGAETWVDATDAPGGLQRALDWAAERRGDGDGLVVLAGSLYLVADFYRLGECQVVDCF